MKSKKIELKTSENENNCHLFFLDKNPKNGRRFRRPFWSGGVKLPCGQNRRLLAAALPQLTERIDVAGGGGREELPHREIDLLEDLAGILVTVLHIAFLVRHAVVIDWDKQLGIPLQPQDGELPQAEIDPPNRVVVQTDGLVKGGLNSCGHLGQDAFAAHGALTHIAQL